MSKPSHPVGSTPRFLVSTLLPALLVGAFAGCFDPPIVYSDLRAAFDGQFEEEGGVLLFEQPMMVARFVGPNASENWSSAPFVNYTAPPMTINKTNPGATGGGGVMRQLKADLKELTLEVRLLHPENFTGYVIGWATRVGDPLAGSKIRTTKTEEIPCQNLNLNAPKLKPANATFSIPARLLGIYMVQAEVLRGTERAAIFCNPLVGRVNANWHVEGTIYPVGIDVLDTFRTPEYDQMADRFPFDVGRAVGEADGRTFRGRLGMTLTYRGEWTPEKGSQAQLAVHRPGDLRDNCPSVTTLDDLRPKGPGGFNPRRFDQTIEINGIWTAKVGAIDACQFFPQTYVNAGPVPYSLDVNLRFGCLVSRGAFIIPGFQSC